MEPLKNYVALQGGGICMTLCDRMTLTLH